MPLVLTADDSAAIQRVVQVSLTPCAIDVISADSFPAALDKTATQQVDLIIADAELNGVTALPDLQRLTAAGKIPLILLLSSYSKIDKSTLTELDFNKFCKSLLIAASCCSWLLLTCSSILTKDAVQAGSRSPRQRLLSQHLRLLGQRAHPHRLCRKRPRVLRNTMDGVDHNFAALVKKAVFEYCQNNFPRIAREMVLAEIRRLQNEKSDSVTSN